MTKTSQLQHPLDTPFLQNSGAAMVQPLRIIDDSGKTHLGLLSRATNRGGGEQLKHHTGGALEAEDLKKGPSLGRIQAALREQREETAAIFATFTEEDIERIMDKKYGFDDQQINEVKAAAQVLEKNDLCQKILSMEAGSLQGQPCDVLIKKGEKGYDRATIIAKPINIELSALQEFTSAASIIQGILNAKMVELAANPEIDKKELFTSELSNYTEASAIGYVKSKDIINDFTAYERATNGGIVQIGMDNPSIAENDGKKVTLTSETNLYIGDKVQPTKVSRFAMGDLLPLAGQLIASLRSSDQIQGQEADGRGSEGHTAPGNAPSKATVEAAAQRGTQQQLPSM